MGGHRWVSVTLSAFVAVGGLMLAALAGGVTASAVADVVTTTAATTTSTVAATTSAETTTTPAVTTTPPPTTLATTTNRSTTTRPTTTAAPIKSAFAAVTDRALTNGCPVSAVAVVRPGRVAGLVGPVTAARGDDAVVGRLDYAVDGPVFSGRDVRVTGGGCGGLSHVSITSVSLFGGALSADAISLATGRHDVRSISGLRVGHARASASSTRWVPLEGWGEWRAGSLPGAAVAALAVRLTRPHAGLPAGTVVLVAVAGSPARATVAAAPAPRHVRRRRKRPAGRPLHVTPPLAVAHEIFPVAGVHVAFGDTYGALRTDVAGDWHHGDDIFAPLGTPVVAVADGTINRVGWNEVGGWRLWVRDDAGDEFYYAHLSGYTRADLRSKRVRAGEVIGFVGNTGDAFTTAPHLHFEIHPRPLLHLGYNGAVDPTRYLEQWSHLGHVRTPRPAHPALPTQPAVRAEASEVWRELLSARHLVRRPALERESLPILPHAIFTVPTGTPATRARPARPAVVLAGPLALLSVLAAAFAYRRRRRAS